MTWISRADLDALRFSLKHCTAHRNSALNSLAECEAQIETLRAQIPQPSTMSVASANEMLAKPACEHCGRLHPHDACPRVKRLHKMPTGEFEVWYWPDGQWDDAHSVSVEEVAAIVEDDAAKRKAGESTE